MPPLLRTSCVALATLGLVAAQGQARQEKAPPWPQFRGFANHTAASAAAAPRTGAVAWSAQIGSGLYSSPAVGADGTVFYGTYDKRVVAIRPPAPGGGGGGGALAWSFPVGNIIDASPAVGADGTVYVADHDSTLWAVRAGALVWQRPIGFADVSSVALNDGVLYLAAYLSLLAVRAADGALVWRWTADTKLERSSPAVGPDGATVYVGGCGRLYAVRNATLLWAITLGGNNEDNVLSSPAVGRDGTVYVSSTSGSVYAVRPPAAGGDAVGTLLWSLATGGPCYSSVALAPDGSVVVGSYDQLLWILRPNGTVARRYNTGVPVSSSPAVSADGIAFIGANDLLAINTTDGTLLWRAAVNVDVQNQSPAVGADGTVIVTGIGGVIAVGAGGAGD